MATIDLSHSLHEERTHRRTVVQGYKHRIATVGMGTTEQENEKGDTRGTKVLKEERFNKTVG